MFSVPRQKFSFNVLPRGKAAKTTFPINRFSIEAHTDELHLFTKNSETGLG